MVFAGLALAGITLSVDAGKPDFIGPIHEEGVSEIAGCGSFQILDEYVLNYTLRFYYDRDGELIRLGEHVWGTDTLVNSETGKSLTGTFANNVEVDPDAELGANAGVIFRFTVPGAGVVFLDVGRIVSNRDGTVITFQAGPHQFFDGDLAGLCAALS